jgi:hypothetical protein
MPTPPIASRSQIIFMSPGVFNDGGGIEIVIGTDGKPHIVRVPPWDGPDTASALNAVASALSLAAITDKPNLRVALENIAQTITQSYAAEFSNWVQKAPVRQAEGAVGA